MSCFLKEAIQEEGRWIWFLKTLAEFETEYDKLKSVVAEHV